MRYIVRAFDWKHRVIDSREGSEVGSFQSKQRATDYAEWLNSQEPGYERALLMAELADLPVSTRSLIGAVL